MAIKKAVSKSVKKTAGKSTTVSAARVSKKGPSMMSLLSKKTPFIGALIAEFIGTFLLAVAVITQQGNPIIIMFAVAGIVLLIGTMSGSHINPAVTIGAWITRKIKLNRAVGYIVAQFLGALSALGLLTAFAGGADQPSAAAQSYGQTAAQLFTASPLVAGKEWYVFFAELVGTLILGFAVASVLKSQKDKTTSALTYGFGIFVALILAAAAAAYVSATAVLNPAVALSLDALKWEVWPLAVYVLAPVIGGVAGFYLQDLLSSKSDGGND